MSTPPPTPLQLSQQITDWVGTRTEAIFARFFAGPVLPRFQAGHIIGAESYTSIIRLLGHLHALGVTCLADASVEAWICRFLPTVDGEQAQTFGSLFLAETLLEWGPFEGNPLLDGLSAEQRANLAEACDTSHIYREDGTIGEWSANYWMVLARVEFARQRLGLLRSASIMDAALQQCRRRLLEQTEDYFDDSATGVGRYDNYSMGVMNLCKPFWHLLPRAPLRARLGRDVSLLETLAMENGASIVWGRSLGAGSLTKTLGLALTGIREGLSHDPGRLFALAANAATQVPSWYRDDLIVAHRERQPFGYYGPHRLLGMSVGTLDSLAEAARSLRDLPPQPAPRGPVFPPRDEVIRFDSRNAGVWMFRNEHMAFQLPFVSAWLGADYVPWLHSPGLFDNPVDSPLRFGVPVVLLDGKAFGPGELPASVTKFPDGLTLAYDSLMEEVAGGWMPNPAWKRIPAKLSLTWRIQGDAVHLEQRLALDRVPDGLVISMPQAGRPLAVEVVACSVPFSRDTVVVDGMGQYRSCWNQLTAVHELHLQPAAEISLHFVIRPGPYAPAGTADTAGTTGTTGRPGPTTFSSKPRS